MDIAREICRKRIYIDKNDVKVLHKPCTVSIGYF